MTSPDKYIRLAYITALESATGVKVWHKKVPKNVTAPTKYIILDSLTKNETERSKPDGSGNSQTRFEWLCTIDVNIYNVNQAGYTSSAVVDDLEQIVLNVVRGGIVSVQGFHNKDTRILESLDLSVETSTQSIDRKLVKFEHWLNEKSPIG